MPYTYGRSPHCKSTVTGPYMKFFALPGVSAEQLYDISSDRENTNKLGGDLGEVLILCTRH